MEVYPQWSNVTDQERERLSKEPKAFLRAPYEKRKDKPGSRYNVLTFDESTWYSVNTAGIRNWRLYHDVDIVITEYEVSKGESAEFIIELRPKPICCEATNPPLRIARTQALKLAAVLINAARFIQQQQESVDDE